MDSDQVAGYAIIKETEKSLGKLNQLWEWDHDLSPLDENNNGLIESYGPTQFTEWGRLFLGVRYNEKIVVSLFVLLVLGGLVLLYKARATKHCGNCHWTKSRC